MAYFIYKYTLLSFSNNLTSNNVFIFLDFICPESNKVAKYYKRNDQEKLNNNVLNKKQAIEETPDVHFAR